MWGIAEAKYMVVTAVCASVSVCLSVCHLLHSHTIAWTHM